MRTPPRGIFLSLFALTEPAPLTVCIGFDPQLIYGEAAILETAVQIETS